MHEKVERTTSNIAEDSLESTEIVELMSRARRGLTYRDSAIVVLGLFSFVSALIGLMHVACRLLWCPEHAWVVFTGVFIVLGASSQHLFVELWHTRRRPTLLAGVLAYLLTACTVLALYVRGH